MWLWNLQDLAQQRFLKGIVFRYFKYLNPPHGCNNEIRCPFVPLRYAISSQEAMACALTSHLSNWKIHFLLWQATWSRALLPWEKGRLFPVQLNSVGTSFPCIANQILLAYAEVFPSCFMTLELFKCMLAFIFSITQWFFQFFSFPYQPLCYF